jgi:hypothetical protein
VFSVRYVRAESLSVGCCLLLVWRIVVVFSVGYLSDVCVVM